MKRTRTIGIVLAIVGIALLLIGLTAPLFMQETVAAPSIGIIGGADGPTAIFVTAPPWVQYAVPAVMLLVGIWGFVRLSRCKPKE